MKRICFFLGTEAELIKVCTVIRSLEDRKNPYILIASGQNDLTASRVLQYANGGRIDLELSKEKDIRKSARGLLSWYMNTEKNAAEKIKKAFPDLNYAQSIMVVHGDTVSTVMGARIGKKLGMTVAHVEAGLRSHNWFNPFPEEIDRSLVSDIARIHFAPGDEAVNNLRKAKGTVINTKYNTIIDSINASRNIECASSFVDEMTHQQYVVLVLHRQENLANTELVKKIVSLAENLSRNQKCVFIMHKPTEVTLRNLGLYEELEADDNIILPPRTDYFDFTKLLSNAQFVITDGGSNQEELSYMGVPCCIVRKNTERNDGLGENAVLYQNDFNVIAEFAKHPENYRREPVIPSESPTEIIAEELVRRI
ncbi:MAG: UDP-N-acetylglucosamine 2-epimerase [Bulleidia sp.]|nr:UDP-N-acetylglucosamine 2-epimerase [Bulleidia sp.]